MAEERWLEDLCKRLVARLAPIDGIAAIALGGSRARCTAGPDSDVDIGLYYDPDTAFSIEELDVAARELDDRHLSKLVTRLGDWGPGVNGGGWLLIEGRHVDFLYRDLKRVRETIEQCREGKVGAVYQLGHPMGFQSQIHLGEVHYCRPLYDPAGELTALKALAKDYPPKMRDALIEKHLFDAGFELEIASKAAARGDLAYVTGCLFRAAEFMTLVLYAINRQFFMNEKNAFVESRSFRIVPRGFHRTVETILGRIGKSPAEMNRSVAAMRAILEDVRRACFPQSAAN
jgi:predicted nucleotidyltransferase